MTGTNPAQRNQGGVTQTKWLAGAAALVIIGLLATNLYYTLQARAEAAEYAAETGNDISGVGSDVVDEINRSYIRCYHGL